jgi:iron complex outermembrane recepter protein
VLFSSVLLAHNTKGQDVLNTRISINLDNTELKSFLYSVENTAKVKFTYSNQMVSVKRKISINAQNERLEEVLNRILKPLSIGYEVFDRQIVLNKSVANPPLSIPSRSSSSIDKIEVKSIAPPVGGKVKDSKTDEYIVGANVVIKGTTKGATTDVNGSFSLDANVGDILVVSYIGYTPKEITVTEGGNLIIGLDESPSLLGEAVVVGSRFTKPRTDVDRPVPIDVINLKEIQQTGQVDLGQAIHYSAPSFNAMKFGINDAAPFVDPATLRGLGPDQVLVLVNNKRRHKVSFLSINDGVGKGQAGTDINVVPALSLKRVEVLRDGAAAQYGSDAIAGVINMQLNNASSGGGVTTYYGQGYSKPNLDIKNVKTPILTQDGKTYNLAANVGLKLGEKGFLNSTLSYSHTDGYDRSGSYSSPNATSASTNFYSRTQSVEDSLLKANNINLDRAVLGSAENTTYGVFVNAGLPINANWDAYAFGGYTKKHVVTGVFTRPPSNARRNSLTIFPNGYNPIAPADLQDLSITAGVKGKFGKNWNLDFSAGQGSNKVDFYAKNTVNPSLGAASPTEFYVGQTFVSQTLFNADITKTFNEGNYPNFSLGAGTEFRAEKYQQTAGDKAAYEAGSLKTTKDVGSSGREGFSDKTAGTWKRTNVGVYVEGESDITKQILLGAAIRGENYSDFGSDVSAKVNTRIKIIDQLAIRGSVSRGFRAPSITQSHYSNYVNVSFDNAGNSILNPIIPVESALAQALGINGLKKETSLDFSGGITSKLGEHFLFTADVYQIDVDNRVMLSGQIDVSKIQTFKDAGFAQSANVFVNAIDTRTKGFEFVANYNTSINDNSKVTLNAAYSSMVTTLRGNRKTSTGIEVVNFDAAAYITDGLPKNKLIVSANYTIGKVGFLLRVSRFGEVTDPLATYDVDVNKDGKFANYTDATTKLAVKEVDAALQEPFSAKILTDVSISYNFTKKFVLSVGVNNIGDVYPDLLLKPQTTSEVIYSRRTNQFGTQGRFINASLNYSF